ncbi:D-ala-D-ala transporter subunit; membrane component of ABC superfamily [Mesorhizobium plurifarium]|uniref:D-ala-D-ala transporter subunit membrane component of ABC superfamily n=1 Tax=Mesorhizobium plurifarium TaxID=69974 RepID=A0A090DCG6_MESPL|nr:D-ala-D-ala transporter subunit; membrane component of ABC superfamily [Mesorhizobium plurifarium]CDX32628.1 D-ala-D-ala transporter subunit; membrane component of ABC superfamily [Mesorhizobium plurifarium]
MSISTQPTRRTIARPKGVLLPLALLVLVILAAFTLLPGLIAPHDPIALAMADRLKPPSLTHIFGTDEGGRDVFSRIVYGTRYSLGVAIAIVFASALFGVIYGAVSGMARQGIDNLMMRIVDLFFGFPALVLALAVAASIGRGLDSVALSLAIIWWPGYARLVRGEVLRLRERPHVEAARALGVSEMTILRRHIIPFVVQEVNVRVTTDIGYALVAVTALSFLGLGANSPTPEWGLLIRDSRPYFGSAWWYLVFPGTMIMLTATAFSLIGDALASRRAA